MAGRSRTKSTWVAVVAGAALIVAGVAGVFWRQIYYALRPEARFWGRWEVVQTEPSSVPIRMVVEFGRDRNLRDDLGAAEAATDVLLDDLYAVVYLRPKYVVTRDRILLSGPLRFPDASFVDTRTGSEAEGSLAFTYRFETEDRLIIDRSRGVSDHGDETVVLRRLPDKEP